MAERGEHVTAKGSLDVGTLEQGVGEQVAAQVADAVDGPAGADRQAFRFTQQGIVLGFFLKQRLAFLGHSQGFGGLAFLWRIAQCGQPRIDLVDARAQGNAEVDERFRERIEIYAQLHQCRIVRCLVVNRGLDGGDLLGKPVKLRLLLADVRRERHHWREQQQQHGKQFAQRSHQFSVLTPGWKGQSGHVPSSRSAAGMESD